MRYFLLLLLLSASLSAEIKLPNVYSDHAVLQREKPIHIWGFSAPDEKVQVDFHDQHIRSSANSVGMWEVYLLPEKAGGPYSLTVSGSATSKPVERTDILVGDVWFASGQSNMEMRLQGSPQTPVKDSAKEIAGATFPKMRLLMQHRRTVALPLYDTDDTWQTCTPDTAKNFSAIAFFFGRKIMQEENVPVGLIDSTWGGTPAHSWISQEGLAWANLTSVMKESGSLIRDQGKADAILNNYKAQDAALRLAGKETPTRARLSADHFDSWIPSSLYNGMVAPFTGFTIKGWLWYQGETDTRVGQGDNYSRTFPSLINDWRRQWAEGPLPFLFVQISSFEQPATEWGRVRDAQRQSLSLVNTGMAVTLDLGEAKNIHPANKQAVADRLIQEALRIAYHQPNQPEAPAYLQSSTEGASIRVWFTNAEGLSLQSKPESDFEVAGEDGRFVPAIAKVSRIGNENTILLSAPSVPAPKFARYGWASNVQSYVYNGKGLPLGTFTSTNTY